MSNARNLANLLGTNTTVQTAKIADDAITAAKIADDAVVAAAIADGAIDGTDFTSYTAFTPSYGGFTLGANSNNLGRYVKVGKLVYVYTDLQNFAWTGGGGSLTMTLPLTAGSNQRGMHAGRVNYYYIVNNLGNGDEVGFYIPTGGTTVSLYKSVNNSTWTNVTTPSANGSNGYLNLSFHYEVA